MRERISQTFLQQVSKLLQHGEADQGQDSLLMMMKRRVEQKGGKKGGKTRPNKPQNVKR